MRTTAEVIDGLFEAAATGRTSDVLRWWDQDGVLDDVTLARRYRGHSELRPYLDMYYAAYPDLSFAPSRVLVQGPYAAVEWAHRCHFSGVFDGIQPDGRELRLRALDLFEIRDGLVVRESGWYGDGWLIDRLTSADAAHLPEPLPPGEDWGATADFLPRDASETKDTAHVIDELFGAAATGVVGDVLAWWAPDGILDDITIARRVRGHRELDDYLTMYYGAFPDLRYRPKLTIIDGAWALIEWAETCHLESEFDGIRADGRELRLRAVDLFDIADGVVRRESSWYGDGWLRHRLTDPIDAVVRAPLARDDAS